jgi:anti-sigma regulatory factor (Ser/Thr protein kinase)
MQTLQTHAHRMEIVVPGDARAPGLARRVVNEPGMIPAELRQTVELLLSEMVSNSVLAAPDEAIEIRVAVDGGDVHVEVHDHGRGGVVIRSDAERESDGHGFGMYLVDRLSTRWGTSVTPDRSIVWFDIGTAAAQHAA